MKLSLYIVLITAVIVSSCVEEESMAVENKLLNKTWLLQFQTVQSFDEGGNLVNEFVDNIEPGYLEFFNDGTYTTRDTYFSWNFNGIYFNPSDGVYFLEHNKRYIHFNKGLNEQVYWPEVYFEIKELTEDRMVLVFIEETRSYEETYRYLGYQTGRVFAQEANFAKDYEDGYELGINYGDYIGFYENLPGERHINYYDAFCRGFEQGWNEFFNNDGTALNQGFQDGVLVGYDGGKSYALSDVIAGELGIHGKVVYTYEFIRE